MTAFEKAWKKTPCYFRVYSSIFNGCCTVAYCSKIKSALMKFEDEADVRKVEYFKVNTASAAIDYIKSLRKDHWTLKNDWIELK